MEKEEDRGVRGTDKGVEAPRRRTLGGVVLSNPEEGFSRTVRSSWWRSTPPVIAFGSVLYRGREKPLQL